MCFHASFSSPGSLSNLYYTGKPFTTVISFYHICFEVLWHSSVSWGNQSKLRLVHSGVSLPQCQRKFASTFSTSPCRTFCLAFESWITEAAPECYFLGAPIHTSWQSVVPRLLINLWRFTELPVLVFSLCVSVWVDHVLDRVWLSSGLFWISSDFPSGPF